MFCVTRRSRDNHELVTSGNVRDGFVKILLLTLIISTDWWPGDYSSTRSELLKDVQWRTNSFSLDLTQSINRPPTETFYEEYV